MLKKNKFDDLEDMVYRLELTKDKIIDVLDLKNTSLLIIGYTLPNEFYEIRDIDFVLQSLLPNEVEVKISIDDITLRSDSSINRTIKFTKKSFFCIILGFSRPHLG